MSLYCLLISFILSIIISLLSNKAIIYCNIKKHNIIADKIRNLGLCGQRKKEGTPTFGGISIIISTLIPTFFFSQLNNIYVLMLISTTLWMGAIGVIDDYIKIKYNKKGLNGIFKILGQLILGIFIGCTMYFNRNITIIDNAKVNIINNYTNDNSTKKIHCLKTTCPIFFRNDELDYTSIMTYYNKTWYKYTWIIFVPIIMLLIVFMSNSANLSDGLDGLTSGVSSIIVITLFLFTCFSSHKFYHKHSHFMCITNIEEIMIFSISLLGALIGFYWYNAYPAQIFMGDTGSLTIGSVLAVISIFLRKELLFPVIFGIFFVENISVVIQVLFFKFYKTMYGIEKRIFLMSPIHHHFQKLGYHENKIVNRFCIIQIILSSLIIFYLINAQ
ncbi:phospho-N-acetylmuramoyl-pentapeptide-transferase [Blattabacterium cuenoti]|uniref:phospho-N-acetylmuramoyl-pentapeptide- transferase n=1 Tax=Blattabacterium cuenoti TaxID=1653831 RepID=UPI00163B7A6C|nr:phospho-N-acetylmuramoyl-pentapeptide-transferase [Blattabacterium cuenoti]